MLHPVCQNPQGESLNQRDRLFSRLAVSKHSRQVYDFSQEPPVLLLVNFYGEPHLNSTSCLYGSTISHPPSDLSLNARITR
jgi:hypothetical protein